MRNVFVVAHDDFNRRHLEEIEPRSDCRFHPLLGYDEVKHRHHGRIDQLLDSASATLHRFRNEGSGAVDGIVGFWDFPAQTMVPILRRRFSLPGPSLESVLKCEHKYWSRLEQRAVLPDLVPAFAVVDPFVDDPGSRIGIEPPYWIKPIKATGSQLCYRIADEKELEHALVAIRERIGHFGVSFAQLMAHADVPPEIARVTGHHCVAESALDGEQCTVSGYVHRGEVVIYGVVDSVSYPGSTSFLRYQYPSALPAGVKARLSDAATRLMRHLGFDDEAFNIEFFYQAGEDRVGLLEVNPRMSQSFGFLYGRVDGAPDHAIAADLAVGRRPDFPCRQGPCAHAAKFYLRAFHDAVVTRAPDAAAVSRAEREVGDAMIDLKVTAGTVLSELAGQDAYSFDLAHVYVGGASERELLESYRRCVELLAIELQERS